MAYYVKYNNIDLTDKIKVRNVETTLTPPRENSTINIWERAGEIYDGYRWGNREITLSFLLMYSEDEYDNNPLIVEEGLADIKSCFNVDEPKELYLNDPEKLIYAIPDGDIAVNELRYNCVEITVNFVCYDPFYYNVEAKKYEGTRRITVENEGDVPTDPIITIGIDADCHFVQLENTANNKKMLIGGFPLVSKTSVSEKTDVLNDNCKAPTSWTTDTTYIDSDRSTGGSLGVTSNGSGLMCTNFGSAGSTTWHGMSARRNLDSTVADFQVEAFITHVSSGTNGDPKQTIDMSNPTVKYPNGSVQSGTRTTTYKVTCSALNVRAGAGTKYKVVGTLKKGDTITPLAWNGDWARIGTDKWCCCSSAYVQKNVKDTTTVKPSSSSEVLIMNYYTTSSAEVRQKAKKESKLVCTIPAGEIVRLSNEKIYDGNDNYFFKLEAKWEGNKGYIDGTKVMVANNVSIEYPEEPETADDKTGTIEIYGYDSNNVQLFKMSMTDENEYYEFNYPKTVVNGKTLLTDTSVAPQPKTSKDYNTSGSKLTVTKDYLRSGQYGTWNDFYGKLGIKRVNGYWQCWFIRMKKGQVIKQVFSENRKISGSPQGKLSYITIYIGTSGDKPSDMSIENLEVKNLSPKSAATNNIKKFQAGDVLKVDCYNNRVWLNNKLYNNIEIGSQFFPLEVGENTIRVTSDKSVFASVIFNEKYI